jgi:hypothetical protein
MWRMCWGLFLRSESCPFPCLPSSARYPFRYELAAQSGTLSLLTPPASWLHNGCRCHLARSVGRRVFLAVSVMRDSKFVPIAPLSCISLRQPMPLRHVWCRGVCLLQKVREAKEGAVCLMLLFLDCLGCAFSPVLSHSGCLNVLRQPHPSIHSETEASASA